MIGRAQLPRIADGRQVREKLALPWISCGMRLRGGADAVWILDAPANRSALESRATTSPRIAARFAQLRSPLGALLAPCPVEWNWIADGKSYFAARSDMRGQPHHRQRPAHSPGILTSLAASFANREYYRGKAGFAGTLSGQLLLIRLLFTVLLVFAVIWVARFLRTVTVPIQALAEGRPRSLHGNF